VKLPAVGPPPTATLPWDALTIDIVKLPFDVTDVSVSGSPSGSLSFVKRKYCPPELHVTEMLSVPATGGRFVPPVAIVTLYARLPLWLALSLAVTVKL